MKHGKIYLPGHGSYEIKIRFMDKTARSEMEAGWAARERLRTMKGAEGERALERERGGGGECVWERRQRVNWMEA
jgi:hypothetical protein